jgi:hypothetical protein
MYSDFEFVGEVLAEYQRTVASACSRGAAFGQATPGHRASAVAAGNNFLGFVDKEIVASPRPLANYVFGLNAAETDGILETPYLEGDLVRLVDCDVIEVETGSGFLKTSSTGALSTSTAVGVGIGFDTDGKFMVAQAEQAIHFVVEANSGLSNSTLAVRNGGTFRLRLRRAKGHRYIAAAA